MVVEIILLIIQIILLIINFNRRLLSIQNSIKNHHGSSGLLVSFPSLNCPTIEIHGILFGRFFILLSLKLNYLNLSLLSLHYVMMMMTL